ncbi:cytosolic factor, phosphatidylinositol/phosphatidylcholine transfer protein [Nowakowskiella sp. JEL0407]|nr:cytosolic factor, phosphatidylinositol/phosphatidylcholine transfer protein [Nowakowskiella sp. JEL0407]
MSVAPNQQGVLEQFKKELQDAGAFDAERHDDFLLLRFLRARKFDIPKSKKMFLDCEAWRKEFKVEEIVASFAYGERLEVGKIYPRYYHKTDKQGRPIYIEFLGNLDVKKLLSVTNIDRVMQYHVREYEKTQRYRLPACSAKKGTNIEQCCTILDLKGVKLSEFNNVRKIVQKLSQIAQDYYPETLGRMFIINAPTLFTTIWAVIRNFLDENTLNKISLIGSSYQKQLLEEIDAESLPEMYGGKCACTGGCDTRDIGPWNDGSTPGYPKSMWEDMLKRDMAAGLPDAKVLQAQSGLAVTAN